MDWIARAGQYSRWAGSYVWAAVRAGAVGLLTSLAEAIERERELAAVDELLDRATGILVIEGGVGMGKSSLLDAACRLGLEGIVSKQRYAPYLAGRSGAWVKAKCRPGQEVLIGGWRQEPPRNERMAPPSGPRGLVMENDCGDSGR